MKKKCSSCGKEIEIEYYTDEDNNITWCSGFCMYDVSSDCDFTNEEEMIANGGVFWTTLF